MKQKIETLKDVTIDLLESLDKPNCIRDAAAVIARREACASVYLDTVAKLLQDLIEIVVETKGSVERIRAKI